MVDFLDLPEFFFHQLIEWLELIDLTLLDCSLCCHNRRDLILNYISSYTIHFPLVHDFNIDEEGFAEIPSYWSWLRTRKIYMKEIIIYTIKEASLFLKTYIYRSNKEYANNLMITMRKFSVDLTNQSMNEINDLTMESLFVTLKNFTNLESFSCNSCSMSDEFLESIISFFPNLKEVCITNLPNITDIGVSSIFTASQSMLRKLLIVLCSGVTGTNISHTLLTNLVEFSCTQCNILEGLGTMSLSFAELKSLYLGFLESTFTDEAVRKVLSNLKNLKSLFLHNLGQLSGTSLRDVIPPSLTELTLSFCNNWHYWRRHLFTFTAIECNVAKDGYVTFDFGQRFE
eukprot:gene4285-6072_t